MSNRNFDLYGNHNASEVIECGRYPVTTIADDDDEVVPAIFSEDFFDDNAPQPPESTKAQVGHVMEISQNLMADVSKKDKPPSGDSKMSNFFTLAFGAQKLLPSKPASVPKSEGRFREPRKVEPVKREKDEEEFYCKLCDATVNSLLTWESHIQGKKHLKKVAASQEATTSKEPVQKNKNEEGPPVKSIVKRGRVPKIQAKVDEVDSPCIGLSYISEIWRLDTTLDEIYYCKLCPAVCQPTTIISHIIGYRHRLCYLKNALPNIYEDVKKMSGKKSELSQVLEGHAKRLEKIDGRGQIVVEAELDRTPSPEPFERRRFLRGEPFEPIAPSIMPPSREKEITYPSPFNIEASKFLSVNRRMLILERLLTAAGNRDVEDSAQASQIEVTVASLKKNILQFVRALGAVGMNIERELDVNYNKMMEILSPGHSTSSLPSIRGRHTEVSTREGESGMSVSEIRSLMRRYYEERNRDSDFTKDLDVRRRYGNVEEKVRETELDSRTQIWSLKPNVGELMTYGSVREMGREPESDLRSQMQAMKPSVAELMTYGNAREMLKQPESVDCNQMRSLLSSIAMLEERPSHNSSSRDTSAWLPATERNMVSYPSYSQSYDEAITSLLKRYSAK